MPNHQQRPSTKSIVKLTRNTFNERFNYQSKLFEKLDDQSRKNFINKILEIDTNSHCAKQTKRFSANLINLKTELKFTDEEKKTTNEEFDLQHLISLNMIDRREPEINYLTNLISPLIEEFINSTKNAAVTGISWSVARQIALSGSILVYEKGSTIPTELQSAHWYVVINGKVDPPLEYFGTLGSFKFSTDRSIPILKDVRIVEKTILLSHGCEDTSRIFNVAKEERVKLLTYYLKSIKYYQALSDTDKTCLIGLIRGNISFYQQVPKTDRFSDSNIVAKRGDRLFGNLGLLLSGKVEVGVHDRNGKWIQIGFLQKGDYFGEHILQSEGRREDAQYSGQYLFDVIATEEKSIVVKVPAAEFHSLVTTSLSQPSKIASNSTLLAQLWNEKQNLLVWNKTKLGEIRRLVQNFTGDPSDTIQSFHDKKHLSNISI